MQKFKNFFLSMPRTIYILGLVSFFTDISSEMIYPLLPALFTTALGATAFELGSIEGVSEATASILKILSGMRSDRLRQRRSLVVFGYSLSSIFRPLIGLANIWPAILVFRFLDRVGKGVRSSPRDALIADVTAPEMRGRAFGLHRAMDHAGAVVGPLVAALLLTLPGMELKNVFLWAAIPSGITVLILVFVLKEEEGRELPEKTSSHSVLDFSVLKSMDRNFKNYILALAIFTLGNSSDAFLLMRMADLGFSPKWIALLWSAHHVMKMVFNFVGGRWADRFDKRRVIAVGWAVYVFVYLAFAYIDSTIVAVVTFLLYGIYFGLVEPAESALVSNLVSPESRGTAFGVFHFTVGLGILPASLLFGFVWKTWGATQAFLVGAILAMLASAYLLFFVKGSGGGVREKSVSFD